MLTTLLTCLTVCASVQGDPAPIPALIITGQNNHDWAWTSESLRQILEESGKFAVDLTADPASFLADAEAAARYRVFVLDYNGERWGEPAESNFLDAVHDGGTGVAVVHAANNAFPGLVEYEKLVALAWRTGTGHGRFHEFDVNMIDREHPITHGLPDLRAHPDELYHRLVHMHDTSFHVLATAHSSVESGGTGNDEPMIIVKQYGAGRVFHTPLGHVWPGAKASRKSHADRQFRELVVRGTEWAATGDVVDGHPIPNDLSEIDERAGWQLLFDGESLDGWTELAVGGWKVVDGCLVGTGGGDLLADVEYEEFELELEWKPTPGADGGVVVQASVDEATGRLLGEEFQLLDDVGTADGMLPNRSTGARYGVAAPSRSGSANARLGSFRTARIVVRDGTTEHWLDGRRVLEYSSEEAEPSRIGLQGKAGEVWYRSLRVRDLSQPNATSLIDGTALSAWTSLGDALFSVEDGAILGQVGGGAQSFLVSEQQYGDFILEVDVKNEEPGNSGIQVRSHVAESGRLFGYQIEIDPSDRAWSGGLYDEARRGWLDDLSEDEYARGAFRSGEWNRYRIECVGPSIRAWINGVPTADYLDFADLEGAIGLQVHSGNNTKVRWRAPVLRDLGQHAWSPAVGGSVQLAADEGDDFACRITFPTGAAPTAVHLAATIGGTAVRSLAPPAEAWVTDAPNVVELGWFGPRLVADLNGKRFHSEGRAVRSGPIWIDQGSGVRTALLLPAD